MGMHAGQSLKTRICLSCSVTFEPTKSWQKFCKPNCRNLFWASSVNDTTVVLTINSRYMYNWREFKKGIERARAQFTGEYPKKVSAFLLSVWVVMPQKDDPKWQLGRADIDHFVSAILNGFQGAAWADDSRVFQIHAQKRYVENGEKPNCRIQITSLDRRKQPATRVNFVALEDEASMV